MNESQLCKLWGVINKGNTKQILSMTHQITRLPSEEGLAILDELPKARLCRPFIGNIRDGLL